MVDGFSHTTLRPSATLFTHASRVWMVGSEHEARSPMKSCNPRMAKTICQARGAAPRTDRVVAERSQGGAKAAVHRF